MTSSLDFPKYDILEPLALPRVFFTGEDDALGIDMDMVSGRPKFILNVEYWKKECLPTNPNQDYYSYEHQCFFFSSKTSRMIGKNMMRVDEDLHWDIINFFKRKRSKPLCVCNIL